MRVRCRIDGTLLGPRTIGFVPRHPRFAEDAPDTVLTAEIDVDGGETVEFEIHDFHDPKTGLRYQVQIDRVIDDDGHETIVETWERGNTHCISGEYHQHQIINLVVTARPLTFGGGGRSGGLGGGRHRGDQRQPLTGPCEIHVRPPGGGDHRARTR